MNAITAQEPWQTYPVSLDEYNPLVTDGDACIKRITDLSKVLFSDEASVEVYALEEPSELTDMVGIGLNDAESSLHRRWQPREAEIGPKRRQCHPDLPFDEFQLNNQDPVRKKDWHYLLR